MPLQRRPAARVGNNVGDGSDARPDRQVAVGRAAGEDARARGRRDPRRAGAGQRAAGEAEQGRPAGRPDRVQRGRDPVGGDHPRDRRAAAAGQRRGAALRGDRGEPRRARGADRGDAHDPPAGRGPQRAPDQARAPPARAAQAPAHGGSRRPRAAHAEPVRGVRLELERRRQRVLGVGEQVDERLAVVDAAARPSPAWPPSSWTATIVAPSQSQRCASTDGAPVSSSVSVPKPSSGHSRRRRIRRSNQFSSESGSRRWAATLTCSGPYAPSTIGRRSCSGRGREAAVRLTTASARARRSGPRSRGSRPSRSPRRRTAPACPGSENASEYDHPDRALVAAEHRRQPAAQPAPVELQVLVGPEAREDLLALGLAELVERELVVVAHEAPERRRRAGSPGSRAARAPAARPRRARAPGRSPGCR